MAGLMSLGLFLAAGLSLLAGFPVAFTLAGIALIFAFAGIAMGIFDPAFLGAFRPGGRPALPGHLPCHR